MKSLRKGIEEYDRRQDGEVLSQIKLKNNNWKKKIISNFKLDPTLNWDFAEIISFDNKIIKFNK